MPDYSKKERFYGEEKDRRLLLLSRAQLQPGARSVEARRAADGQRPRLIKRSDTQIQPAGLCPVPEGGAQRPRHQETLPNLERRGGRRGASHLPHVHAGTDTRKEAGMGGSDAGNFKLKFPKREQ